MASYQPLIVGLGAGGAQNPPPVDYLGAIYNALRGTYSRQIIINGYGEALGHGQYINWAENNAVATFVNNGGVWVDVCGWPMYYQVSPQGTVATLGAGGFQTFAKNIGFGWLNQVRFTVSLGNLPIFGNFSNTYPFGRGFPLSASLTGLCYNNGTFANYGGGILGSVAALGMNNMPITADGYTALMALHKPGAGYYVYAAWTPWWMNASNEPIAMPPSLIAQFVLDMMAGNTGNYVCTPYQITTQPPSNTQPSPSSPYQPPSGGGSSSKSGGGGGGTTPSPNPLTDLLLFGGVALVLGGGGYLLVRGIRSAEHR